MHIETSVERPPELVATHDVVVPLSCCRTCTSRRPDEGHCATAIEDTRLDVMEPRWSVISKSTIEGKAV